MEIGDYSKSFCNFLCKATNILSFSKIFVFLLYLCILAIRALCNALLLFNVGLILSFPGIRILYFLSKKNIKDPFFYHLPKGNCKSISETNPSPRSLAKTQATFITSSIKLSDIFIKISSAFGST